MNQRSPGVCRLGRAASTNRGEPRHPAEERGVVDFDAAFGEQFLDVPVGQPELQIPTHGQRDDLGREAEPGELRTWGGDPTC